MAESSITWDIIARDRASSTVNRVGGSVETLTRRVSRLAGAFGGAFALERFGEFALKSADALERSRSRLETITANIGGDFAAEEERVQALDARLAAFGFTNADVEGSVASLETATKNLPKALRDVALAADIARGRNISLEEATRILQRVETGHVSQLARLGIQIKDTNGHILSQRAALEQLAQTYQGNASHFADTFAGKQQALRAELGNSAAEIGAALLPAAVDLAHVLQDDVLPVVENSAKFFERHRKVIEPLVGTIIKLGLAWKAYNFFAKAATGIKTAHAAAKLAEGAAPSAAGVGLEAFSVAKPLPVYVVNSFNAGAPFPAPGGATKEAGKTSRFAREIPPIGLFAIPAALALTIGPDQGPVHRDQSGAVRTADNKNALMGRFTANNGGFGDTARAADSTSAAIDKTSESERQLTTSADKTNTSLQNQAKRLITLQTRSLALSGSQDALREAIHNMAVVVGQGNRQLSGNSDAALANRDAFRGAVQSAESYIQSLKDQHVARAKVRAIEIQTAQALLQGATATYKNRDAVVAMLRQLHFLPSQIKKALGESYTVGYNAMVDVANGFVDAGYAAATAVGLAGASLNKNLRLGLGIDGTGQQQANFVEKPTHLKYKVAGVDLAGDFTDGYSKVVKDGVDEASKAAAEKARQAFQKAAAKMRSDTQTIIGEFRSETGSLLQAFSTLQTSGQDILGASGASANFHSQLKANAAQMHTFARLWHRLDRMGLDPRLLAQFAGPDYIPAMQELVASGRRGIRQDNRLERSIARDARGIAQTVTSDRYGRLLHHDLDTLPPKLSREMVRALHHAKFEVSFDTGRHDRHQGRRVRQS